MTAAREPACLAMIIAGNGEVDITSQTTIIMGIDIYARWPEQDDEARQAQMEAWLSTGAGRIGYIREAYHGEPIAVAVEQLPAPAGWAEEFSLTPRPPGFDSFG